MRVYLNVSRIYLDMYKSLLHFCISVRRNILVVDIYLTEGDLGKCRIKVDNLSDFLLNKTHLRTEVINMYIHVKRDTSKSNQEICAQFLFQGTFHR